jgi:hypothetical protein
MRVYLPGTLPQLVAMLSAGQLTPAPLRGYAVTPELREWYSSGDLDELEYVAMARAAKASLRLLADDPEAAARRVVLAADLPDRSVANAGGFEDPGLVTVAAPVELSQLVSGHVDDLAAASDIRAAVAALAAADAGDDDAMFVVDSAEGHELQWYATQELRHLSD